ncbi:MAG: ATP synthase F0 subunit B [Deltaproteobacteria bacterium]|nr:ATP synthase F0 subunit B [Deltaproteobacteria bacterium]
MSIVPDLILVLMTALPFFVALFGLNAILLKPMLAYLESRREATVGARDEAVALQEKAELKLTQWEAALQRANAEVADFRAQRRAEAQATYAARVAQARSEAEARIGDAVAVIQSEATLARESVGRESRQIAADMAARALGRELAAMEA